MKAKKIPLFLSLIFLIASCSKEPSKPVLRIEPCRYYKDASCYLGLAFDDLNLGHLKIAKLLGEYGLKASFYVNTKKMKNCHILMYKHFLQSGHEIGNHTVNHLDLTTLTKSEIEKEIYEAKDTLEKIFNIKCLSFSAPYERLNQNIISSVADSHMFLRQVTYKRIHNKLGLYSKTSFKDAQQYIESFVKDQENFILVGHGIDNQGWEPSSSDFYRQLFQYIKYLKNTKNVWVAPIKDGLLYDSLYRGIQINSIFDKQKSQIIIDLKLKESPIYELEDKLCFSFKIYKDSHCIIKPIQSKFVKIEEFTDYFLFTVDLKEENKLIIDCI